MEYTDNIMYTNTEIAIVTLTYPIDFDRRNGSCGR